MTKCFIKRRSQEEATERLGKTIEDMDVEIEPEEKKINFKADEIEVQMNKLLNKQKKKSN